MTSHARLTTQNNRYVSAKSQIMTEKRLPDKGAQIARPAGPARPISTPGPASPALLAQIMKLPVLHDPHHACALIQPDVIMYAHIDDPVRHGQVFGLLQRIA